MRYRAYAVIYKSRTTLLGRAKRDRTNGNETRLNSNPVSQYLYDLGTDILGEVDLMVDPWNNDLVLGSDTLELSVGLLLE